MYIYVHIHIHLYICTYIHIFAYICIHTTLQILCACVCLRVRLHVCLCVHVFACSCICVCGRARVYTGQRALKWSRKEFGSYGKNWQVGDIIGCCLDLDRFLSLSFVLSVSLALSHFSRSLLPILFRASWWYHWLLTRF